MEGIESYMHQMPGVAVDHFVKNGVQKQQIGDVAGVSRLMPSGHQNGIAFKFFTHHIYNAKASEEEGYEVYDDVDMIQWLVNRKRKPVEQVRFLPDALLRWNRDGDLVGGKLMEAYLAWKNGSQAEGTPLIKWGVLSSGQVATLNAEGIFTVEQFAEKPLQQIEGRFSPSIVEARERAALFIAKMQKQQDSERVERELRESREQNEMLLKRLEELEKKHEAKGVTETTEAKTKKPIVEV